jgi:uncharacterized protein (TIGR02147 family)
MIFDFSNYRSFLKDFLKKKGPQKHGQIARMAKAIGVQPTLMSMVLSGRRDLSNEQTLELAHYFQLTALEKEYLVLLVQFERAGSHRLKSYLKEKLEKIKNDAINTENRFGHEKVLSDQEQAVFYSSWLYSAIRLFCSTDINGKTLNEICLKFSLARTQAYNIISFLKSAGLIVEEKDRLKLGVNRTFLNKSSVHVSRNHLNWRMRALQNLELMKEQEMMFTAPFSISTSDFEKLRLQIADLIQNFLSIVKDSPAEEVACLNIDLFYAVPSPATN